MAARHQLIPGLDLLDLSHGVRAGLVFEHHHIARLPHRRIGLGRDDQAKRLQVRGDAQLGLVRSIRHDFTDVVRPALRSDGPQHISQILAAESLRLLEILELRIDLGAAPPGFHARFTLGFGLKNRTAKVDLGWKRAVLIIDRRNAALDYGDAINRH